jgi:hypothetical protein
LKMRQRHRKARRVLCHLRRRRNEAARSVSAVAKLRPTTRARQKSIAARATLSNIQIKPIKFTQLRCASAELVFSCCGSVVGQRPGHFDQVPARRRGHWPGHHDQVPALHNKATVSENHQVPAMRNERCHGQQPGQFVQVPATHNEATAWAPRPSTCDAQRAAQRATAWAPRSGNCDAKRAAPRATA